MFGVDGVQGRDERHNLKEVGQWVKVMGKSDKDERNYLKKAGFE